MDIEYVKKCSGYYKRLKDDCTKCNHSGIIEKDRMFKDCDCTKVYISDKKYIEAGMPIVYLDKFEEIYNNMIKSTRDNFDKLTFNLEIIRKNTNILLSKTATNTQGSSSVAMLFAKKLIDSGKMCYIINIIDLIQMFFERESQLARLQDVDNLIIDNFGYEYSKNMKSDDFITKKLLAFLQHRSCNNKFTIMSSSRTLSAMQKKYTADIMLYLQANYINFIVDMKRTYESANDKMIEMLPELKEMFETVEKKAPKPVKQIRNVEDYEAVDTGDNDVDSKW